MKTQKLSYVLLVTGVEDDEISDDSEEATEINEPAKKKSKLSEFFADVCKDRSKKSKLKCIVAEVDRYNSEECIDIDGKPLMWLKIRETQYPLMAKSARQYFSIPATSICSEEIFSVAGNILSEKRNRLLPENVDKLVFA